MSLAVVAHTIFQTSGTGTSSAINSTGASLLVVGVGCNALAAPTLTDSKGNTWTSLTLYTAGANAGSRLFYCTNPTVGSGHTFTFTGAAILATAEIVAFSGVAVFGSSTGLNNGNATSWQAGSVTPTNIGDLIVTCFGYTGANAASIDTGFTISDQAATVGGAYYGSGLAYLAAPAVSATNPTWSTTGGAVFVAASIATFKINNIAYTKSVSDMLTLVETFSKSTTKYLQDTVTMLDLIYKYTTRGLADMLSLADIIIKGSGKILTDSLGISDSLQRSMSRNFTEVINWVEEMVRAFSRIADWTYFRNYLVDPKEVKLSNNSMDIPNYGTYIDTNINYFRQYLAKV